MLAVQRTCRRSELIHPIRYDQTTIYVRIFGASEYHWLVRSGYIEIRECLTEILFRSNWRPMHILIPTVEVISTWCRVLWSKMLLSYPIRWHSPMNSDRLSTSGKDYICKILISIGSVLLLVWLKITKNVRNMARWCFIRSSFESVRKRWTWLLGIEMSLWSRASVPTQLGDCSTSIPFVACRSRSLSTCTLTWPLLFNRLPFGSWLFLLINSAVVVVMLLFTLVLFIPFFSVLYCVYDCDEGGALDIQRKVKRKKTRWCLIEARRKQHHTWRGLQTLQIDSRHFPDVSRFTFTGNGRNHTEVVLLISENA